MSLTAFLTAYVGVSFLKSRLLEESKPEGAHNKEVERFKTGGDATNDSPHTICNATWHTAIRPT